MSEDITEEALLARLMGSFRFCLIYVWGVLGLPSPTKRQLEMADYLQYGPKRAILMAFRGIGKSWITSLFVVWSLWRNLDERIMIASASGSRADEFSRFTRKLISEIPIFKELEPREDQQDTVVAFTVAGSSPSHSPSVKSVGITGQITGSRATIIIADDVEILRNSATVEQRENLLGLVGEFDNIIVPEAPGIVPRIIFLGTPQTVDSIYNVKAEQGFSIRIWPGRFPDKENIHKYKGRLAPSILKELEDNPALTGTVTDPERFTEQDMIERELSIGLSAYLLQYMLDTSMSDANKYPLKLRDLIVYPCDTTKAPDMLIWGGSQAHALTEYPSAGIGTDRASKPSFVSNTWMPYEMILMTLDPKGTGEDDIGYSVTALLNGKIFLLDGGGFPGSYDDATFTRLYQILKTWKVNHLLIEDNFGDGMYSNLFKSFLDNHNYEVGMESIKHKTQKEARIISALEPLMNQHRLVVNEAVLASDAITLKERPNYSLFWQLTHITKARGCLRHDDALDALAMAARYWAEMLGDDPEKITNAKREQAFIDEWVKMQAGLSVSHGDKQAGKQIAETFHGLLMKKI